MFLISKKYLWLFLVVASFMQVFGAGRPAPDVRRAAELTSSLRSMGGGLGALLPVNGLIGLAVICPERVAYLEYVRAQLGHFFSSEGFSEPLHCDTYTSVKIIWYAATAMGILIVCNVCFDLIKCAYQSRFGRPLPVAVMGGGDQAPRLIEVLGAGHPPQFEPHAVQGGVGDRIVIPVELVPVPEQIRMGAGPLVFGAIHVERNPRGIGLDGCCTCDDACCVLLLIDPAALAMCCEGCLAAVQALAGL